MTSGSSPSVASGLAGPPPAPPLLRVEDLKVHFPIRDGIIRQRHVGDIQAVDGVTFELARGETLGAGRRIGLRQATTGRAILLLFEADAGIGLVRRTRVAPLGGRAAAFRARMQIIFQDPFASLNPRMTVGAIVGEPLRIHSSARGPSARAIVELLETVGLTGEPSTATRTSSRAASDSASASPARWRSSPKLIVCDEPVSALDVSIQAQIVNLLDDLQAEFGLDLPFIAHDLAVVRHISDRVAVMYLGRIVELAPRDEIYDQPLHPYTVALLSAVPVPDPVVERPRAASAQGDVPSPSGRRPAAASTPVAGCASSSATPRLPHQGARSCACAIRATWSPVTSRTKIGGDTLAGCWWPSSGGKVRRLRSDRLSRMTMYVEGSCRDSELPRRRERHTDIKA